MSKVTDEAGDIAMDTNKIQMIIDIYLNNEYFSKL